MHHYNNNDNNVYIYMYDIDALSLSLSLAYIYNVYTSIYIYIYITYHICSIIISVSMSFYISQFSSAEYQYLIFIRMHVHTSWSNVGMRCPGKNAKRIQVQIGGSEHLGAVRDLRSETTPCTKCQWLYTILCKHIPSPGRFWYPMDLRVSGKDLIQNHLTMA